MSTTDNHIAIAGGGLLGRLLAWHLLGKGYRVTLFEAGSLEVSPAAAYTAAGMISPLSEAAASEPGIYYMGVASLSLWPQWLRRLNETSGETVEFHKNGSLVIAHPQDFAELKQFHQDLELTLGGAESYRWLHQREIQALEPDVSDGFQQGLFLENEGHLDNRKLLRVLLAEIRRQGGHCRENCEVQVEPHRITYKGQTERFDLVLDCRGVGARSQWRGLRGIRGEVLGVQTTEVRLNRPVRLMHPRYQLYVVPKANHCFVIGATQIESESRAPMTLQSSLELSSALYTINPAFAEANIVELGVNLRPGFMNNQPRIQRQPGLIRANGLFRHGYLLAPVVVNHVLGMIEGGETPFAEFLVGSAPGRV